MRDALSILDQCVAYTGETVSEADVNLVLGATGDEVRLELVGHLAGQAVQPALLLLDDLLAQGKDIRQLVKELTEYFRNLLLVGVGGDPGALLAVEPELLSRMKEQAGRFSRAQLMEAINILTNAETEMRWTTSPRWLLEVALLKIAQPAEAAVDLAKGWNGWNNWCKV
jgi:DNA polymerase-3 subunit gamma/tau